MCEGAHSIGEELAVSHDGVNNAEVSGEPVSPARILLYEL